MELKRKNKRKSQWLIAIGILLCACSKSDRMTMEQPSVFRWIKATSQDYLVKGNRLEVSGLHTTGNPLDTFFFYRICQSLRLSKNRACISILDSGRSYDYGSRTHFPETCVPIVNGLIRTEGDTLLSGFQITYDTSTKKAIATTQFIEIPWDSSVSAGVRRELQETIYLKGDESDSLILELIKRRVYKLGLRNQYYGETRRPDNFSKSVKIYPAVVRKYKTEMKMVSD